MVKYSQFVLHIFILNRYTILSTIPAQDEGDTLGQTESSSLLAEVELLHHQSPYKNYKSNFRRFFMTETPCRSEQLQILSPSYRLG